jgi:hypothetical protein
MAIIISNKVNDGIERLIKAYDTGWQEGVIESMPEDERFTARCALRIQNTIRDALKTVLMADIQEMARDYYREGYQDAERCAEEAFSGIYGETEL